MIFGIIIIILIIYLIVKAFSGSDTGASNKPYGNTPQTQAKKKKPTYFLSSDEREMREAGEEGEIIASHEIYDCLGEGECYYPNVEIDIPEGRTELDNVVINKYGVFIIEVKAYSGDFYGSADDKYLTREKTTDAGNVYYEDIKNPIGQVKREIWLFKEYLKSKGIRVFVSGYVYFVNENEVPESEYFLCSQREVDKAIHTVNILDKHPPTDETVRKVCEAVDELQ